MRLVVALLSGLIAAGSARAAEPIEIPAGDLKLKAILFRPEKPTSLPAIVALHGCDGLSDPSGKLRPQYHDWGDKLTSAGFAVVMPDSFGSRDLGPQCRVAKRTVRPFRERLDDANAAREWLQKQPWVQRDRVSLLGWSHGALTVLWTVRPRSKPKDTAQDFRSAVALYPRCRRPRDAAWSARIPTLILVGGLDDWTPARECEQMVAGAKDLTAKTNLIKYPGAYHYFDRANLPVQQRTGLAYTPDGSGHAHVGTNPSARDDALKRVPEWLTR
jgi:dienelactone hydrolase